MMRGRKKPTILEGLIAIIVGIIMLVYSISSIIGGITFWINAKDGTGVITNIHTYVETRTQTKRRGLNRKPTQHEVIVSDITFSYTFNNREYTKSIQVIGNGKGYTEGSTIHFKYNSKNPYEVKTEDSSFFWVNFLIVGMSIFLVLLGVKACKVATVSEKNKPLE